MVQELCERGIVREAEHDDGAIRRIRSQVTCAFTHRFCFAVRVEERHINRALWFSFDLRLDDLDIRLVRAKERAKAFQDDLVVIDECDADRFGHATRMLPRLEDRNTRTGD
jgi:hypothetical protein